jgi:quercetin dioxygenase-like cupin family protein
MPGDVVFKAPFRPGGPAGAIIYGDPTKKGLYVTRAKFAPGQKNMPHWHPDERTVVVLSGTYYFAYGEQWDEKQLKPLPPGSFLTEPPKAPHYNWAKDGEVILQITGYGPTAATAIPQK